METTNTVDRPGDFGKDAPAVVKRWLAELQVAGKACEKWEAKVKKITDRYRDERNDATAGQRKFNILWSNVQVLLPALYSQSPTPDIRRRFQNRDPVARMGSEMLERAVSYGQDEYDFDGMMRRVAEDYVLGGRGIAWVRYDPTFSTTRRPINDEFEDEDGEPVDREAVKQDDDGRYVEDREVTAEAVRCDHVFFKDFRHSVARCWDDVRWVAKRACLPREKLVERFGDVGRHVSLDVKPEGVDESLVDEHGDLFKKAEVWEIWNRDDGKAYWISPGYKDGPLDVKDDPLQLSGFFPCPKPAYGTCTNDSLMPVPDYCEYQDQADELDELTERIALLTKALKAAGIYAADEKDALSQLFSGHDNIMIPVENFAMMADKGGLAKTIEWYPVEKVAEVLKGLLGVRDQVKQDLYEISGISDIIRGESSPSETATAQQIKGQFATLRLRDRQKEIQRFARDLIRIKAEIIAEQFDPETLSIMTGLPEAPEQPEKPQVSDDPEQMQQAVAQWTREMGEWAQEMQQGQAEFMAAVQMLKDDRLRSYRVDIETDSTIAVDENTEKERRLEFMGTVTPVIGSVLEAVQVYPDIAPLAKEMMTFTLRAFKTGRALESAFDDFFDGLTEKQEQPQPPNPETAVAEAEQNRADQVAMADSQRKDALAQEQISASQADTARKDMTAQHDAQVKVVKLFQGLNAPA